MADIKVPYYDNLFNYAAEQTKTDLVWSDVGTKGVIEENELTDKSGKKISLEEAAALITKVDAKAKQLQGSALVFGPTPAATDRKVYVKTKQVTPNFTNLPTANALFDTFVEYAQLPANSCQEGEIAKKFSDDLKALGFSVNIDDAAKDIQCDGTITGSSATIAAQTGNVLGVKRGNSKLPSIGFSVHLDGTEPQTSPIKVIREGNVVKSDGTSILRADDGAGISIVLNLIEFLEKYNIPHGDLYVTGLVAEEAGAFGAAALDGKDIGGDVVMVFDGYTAKQIVVGGSDIYTWKLTVKGQSKHVSLAPEVPNADVVAAKIFADGWKIGTNSGFNGNPQTLVVATHSESGVAETDAKSGETKIVKRNSVPDTAVKMGQIRTQSPDSKKTVIEPMQASVDAICQEAGVDCTFETELALPGFQDTSMPFTQIVDTAWTKAGLPNPDFLMVHGGSNQNFMFGPHDGNIVNVGIGVADMHTTRETWDLDDSQVALKAAASVVYSLAEYSKK